MACRRKRPAQRNQRMQMAVGRLCRDQHPHMSDSDHRRMALEGDYKGDRNVASTEGHEGEGSERISEREVETLTEEFVNKEKASEKLRRERQEIICGRVRFQPKSPGRK